MHVDRTAEGSGSSSHDLLFARAICCTVSSESGWNCDNSIPSLRSDGIELSGLNTRFSFYKNNFIKTVL